MKKTNKRHMYVNQIKISLTIIIVVFVLYAIVSIASIGRFEPTHAIVKSSSCLGCHMYALVDLNDSRHIGRHAVDVGRDQSIVIDSYILLSNSTDINGLCMSCHNLRYKDFGFVDPYITRGSDGENIAVINGIVFWNRNWNLSGAKEDSKDSITVTIGVQDIIPDNTYVTIDSTVQLKNFSGSQNHSDLSTNIIRNLYTGESATIKKDDIYGDYFEVYVRVMGDWNFSSINVSVDDYPVAIINSTGESYYTLPVDLPYQYAQLTLFHTDVNYIIKRADIVDQEWRGTSVMSISLTDEPMTNYIWNTTAYTCGSPDARCHINQRMTIMGQEYGIGDGRYYSHEMSYATSNTCKGCHTGILR